MVILSQKGAVQVDALPVAPQMSLIVLEMVKLLINYTY
jgi:hypothetical protein